MFHILFFRAVPKTFPLNYDAKLKRACAKPLHKLTFL